GALVLASDAGTLFRLAEPLIYQEQDGRRTRIAGAYTLQEGGQVGITVGDYDRSRPLVVDPVLVYASPVGGSGYDQANGLTVGRGWPLADKRAYLTGATASLDFPEMASPFPAGAQGGSTDAFVSVLDPTRPPADQLVFSAYLGGS